MSFSAADAAAADAAASTDMFKESETARKLAEANNIAIYNLLKEYSKCWNMYVATSNIGSVNLGWLDYELNQFIMANIESIKSIKSIKDGKCSLEKYLKYDSYPPYPPLYGRAEPTGISYNSDCLLSWFFIQLQKFTELDEDNIVVKFVRYFIQRVELRLAGYSLSIATS